MSGLAVLGLLLLAALIANALVFVVTARYKGSRVGENAEREARRKRRLFFAWAVQVAMTLAVGVIFYAGIETAGRHAMEALAGPAQRWSGAIGAEAVVALLGGRPGRKRAK